MKKENLVHHIKVIHTQEKDKLQCNWCGKTYQCEHSYKNHYKSDCIKRYEEEEITSQMMFQVEVMVRAQAQNFIQKYSNTNNVSRRGGVEGAELSQESEDSVMELT